MSDSMWDCGYDDGYKAARKDYRVVEVRAALIEALAMMQEIERLHYSPSEQAVTLGKTIMGLVRVLPHDSRDNLEEPK